jgi:hypothetical protein
LENVRRLDLYEKSSRRPQKVLKEDSTASRVYFYDYSQLPGLKISLAEKLGVLNTLDKDIVDKIDDHEGVADDVEEADERYIQH